jgi:hypothetical protein
VKQKRWGKNEDKILKENIHLSIKELAILLNRGIPSIKSRKKILKLTVDKTWSGEEENILKQKYSILNKEKLLELLPKRTWSQILSKAKTFNLSRLKHYHNSLKKHNLEKLLKDTNESYYFIGLLMADGYFTERSIIFSQTEKNSQIVENFGEYIECKNIKDYNKIGYITINNKQTFGNNKKVINATDLEIVPKIKDKFNINYQRNSITKTYYPPNYKLFNEMEDNLFLSYFIGFIDGDGSISKSIRNGNTITITSHKNWQPILNVWKNRIETIFGVKLSPKFLTMENSYLRFKIYNKKIVLGLKKFIDDNKLKVNNQKWGRIKC